MKLKTLAIIPCYNEEASIKSTVDDLRSKTPDVDFIIINDGSSDNTLQICLDNGFPVIDMPFNLGLANAVQTGMLYAYKNDYDLALQFDGDGQHLPEYIPKMVDLMIETSADIVIGARKKQKTSFSFRGFGSFLLKIAIKITTGKTITDPTSGLRLYNRKMIKLFANNMNYGPEPDTIAFLICTGALVLETPVTMQERKAGKSYFSTFVSMKYMLQMFISILIIQWFRKNERGM